MSYEFTAERELPTYQHFDYEPLSGALGATISGVNLADDFSQAVFDELYQALLEFKVIFFRDQVMTNAEHLRLARKFGMPQGPGAIPQVEGFPMIRLQRMDEYTTIGSDVNYHADDSFRDYPSKLSILRGLKMPLGGGNTIWCDMEKAYASLAKPLQAFLETLTAEHTLAKSFGESFLEDGGAAAYETMMKRNPPVVHPVVRKHPDTGRKCLWVNQLATSRIMELDREHSDAILEMLLRHAYKPEHECRFYWRDNSVAIWDNRCTQHRGISDFSPAFRLMERIPIIDTLKPSLTPERETPLQYNKDADFIGVEDLFEVKPEITYAASGAVAPTASIHREDDDVPADEDAVEVDPAFLAKLNDNKRGMVFSAGAAARLKKIPRMFRGAAISAVIAEAEQRGSQEVNVAVLQAVQDKRRG